MTPEGICRAPDLLQQSHLEVFVGDLCCSGYVDVPSLATRSSRPPKNTHLLRMR